jgi:hypothetical protein
LRPSVIGDRRCALLLGLSRSKHRKEIYLYVPNAEAQPARKINSTESLSRLRIYAYILIPGSSVSRAEAQLSNGSVTGALSLWQLKSARNADYLDSLLLLLGRSP